MTGLDQVGDGEKVFRVVDGPRLLRALPGGSRPQRGHSSPRPRSGT